ncbi:trace amine-associated receptor 13c-like [Betta splendens]|uniref:Trace amine-associated receptor 13c-like n=1 Tax=Betta splendens TaxID=158456 RepID=A0A9W2XXC8_BETSP|nr:trace amine-associated receptor 13c-like [Betta splendens]
MCLNERGQGKTVTLQGAEVKKVQELKYLGSIVQCDGECGKEVKRRVQAAMEMMKDVKLCFPLLNTSCKRHSRTHTEAMLIYTLLPSMSVLTAVLNLLVIISISHFRQLHTPTNLLLLSLAASDFLVGVIVMPFQILFAEPCWFLGDLMCVLCNVVNFIPVSASTANMVLISVDRYVAVCHSMSYPNKVTEERVQISVLLCWVSSVLYNILFLFDNLNQPGRFNSCYGQCVIRVNGAADMVLSFIIPISAIIILYVRVFVVAVSQARSIRCHTKTVKLRRSGTATVQRSELKAARTLGVIVAVFLICYCSYYCVSLSGPDLTVSSPTVLMGFLIYCNSCLNPVIYAFLYPWFRKSVKLIVTLQILRPNSYAGNII